MRRFDGAARIAVLCAVAIAAARPSESSSEPFRPRGRYNSSVHRFFPDLDSRFNAVRYGRWSGVLRLYNKDGSSRLHKRTMMPLRDANGRVVGVFGVTRPLTRPVPGL